MPLLQGGAQGTVQAVLEVELAVPLHDVREQVAVERRVLVQQSRELEGVLRRDELVETYLTGRDSRPLLRREPVIRIGAPLAHTLEDHARDYNDHPSIRLRLAS